MLLAALFSLSWLSQLLNTPVQSFVQPPSPLTPLWFLLISWERERVPSSALHLSEWAFVTRGQKARWSCYSCDLTGPLNGLVFEEEVVNKKGGVLRPAWKLWGDIAAPSLEMAKSWLLVESCQWPTLTSGEFLWCSCVELGVWCQLATELHSGESTHRGVVCRQACEPREIFFMFILISPMDFHCQFLILDIIGILG
jgi:hypothetical protein